MLYVDSSAWVKRYVGEPQSTLVSAVMADDERWICARHGLVEVHRVITGHHGPAAPEAREFDADWSMTTKIEVDRRLCGLAAGLAAQTQLGTMDALHLAAAWQSAGSDLRMLTFDRRLARAAIDHGIHVVDVE